ncbi:MAG: hypothetical protein ACJ8IR_06620 [Alphaproteobacteria bacterium]
MSSEFKERARLNALRPAADSDVMTSVSERASIGSGPHSAASEFARAVDLRNRAQFLRMIATDCVGTERACLLGIAARYEIIAGDLQEEMRGRQAAG